MTETRRLVDYSSDAAFAIGEDLRVTACNDRAAEALGYGVAEVVGRPCYEVLQAVLPGGQPLCSPDCHMTSCFRRHQPVAAPSCLARRRDGTWIAVGLSTLIVPKRKGSAGNGLAEAIIFLRAPSASLEEGNAGPPLRIFMLGHFGLAFGARNVAVETWKRKSAVALLKYLVAHLGRGIHRERLIDCLWPDAEESKGRERLKVTIYFLRRELEAAGAPSGLIARSGEAYMLMPDSVWVDAHTFERLVSEGNELGRRGRLSEALGCYEHALTLYRGDYLEEDPYLDWCAEERERLRETSFDMLMRLADLYARERRYARAAQTCRTALAREPCRESFHRFLMEHLVRLGQSEAALAQYRRCRRVLAQELGVEPLPETRKLYQEILTHRTTGAAS